MCRVKLGIGKGTVWMCSTDWTDSKRTLSLKVIRKCLCHLFHLSVRLISKGCYCLSNLWDCFSIKALISEGSRSNTWCFLVGKKPHRTQNNTKGESTKKEALLSETNPTESLRNAWNCIKTLKCKFKISKAILKQKRWKISVDGH